MTKRILSLLLLLCMVCSLLPASIVTVSAATTSGTCGAGLNWSFNSITNILTISGSGNMDGFTSWNSTPWDEWKSDITAVRIEEGVTGIGWYAFCSCTNLITVKLPSTLSSIGAYAFSDCSNLAAVSLPNGLTDIHEYAFLNCTALTNVLLPEGITALDTGLFEGCVNLQSVTIPDGVTSIGWCAFSGCSSLRELRLPDTVTSIDRYAFQNCSSLTRAIIPYGVTAIEDYLFDGCSSMAEVSIPQSVTTIGKYAFRNCSALKRVTIPSAVNIINDSAFKDCENLERVTMECLSCTIYSSKYTLGVRGTTEIYGYSGASAEAYAEEFSYTFHEIPTNAEIKINHSLNLASDISINYVVKTELLADYDSYFMEVIVPVYEGDLWTDYKIFELSPVLNGNYYYFTLDGLISLEMNNVVEATLYMTKDGIEYVSNVDRYSIATYAYNQLNGENKSDELKAMCANLLQYGAKAQLWKGYRTDALADAAMTDEHKTYLTNLDTVVFGENNRKLADVENPVITWAGKALRLDSKIIVRFVINTTNYTGNWSDLSLHIRFTNIRGETETIVLTELEEYDASKNYYAFNFDGLLAAELRTVISAAVYEGDTQLSQTTEYSVDTFGNGKTGTLLTVMQAMVAYADSAYAFFDN